MNLHVLFTMQDQRGVELDARRIEDVGAPAVDDHRETWEHLEVLLVGVPEFVRIRGGNSRSDPEVIEDDVIRPILALTWRKFMDQSRFAIDRHGVLRC